MRQEKRIDVWFQERGYGFLHAVVDGKIQRVFLHASNITSGKPTNGALARFEVVETQKGLMAANVEIEIVNREIAVETSVKGGV